MTYTVNSFINPTMKTALILFLLWEIFAGESDARAFGEDTPPNMNGQYREGLGAFGY